MTWAYGLNLNPAATLPEETTVESWVDTWQDEQQRRHTFPSDREALARARAVHGREADVVVAWVEHLSYANLLPAIETLLAEMQERVAEAGGDTTCFDLLDEADIGRLRIELAGALEVWEDELAEEKRSTGVKVRNRRRFPPEVKPDYA